MLPQILKQKLLPLELPLLFLGPPDYRAVKRVADLLGALPSYSNLGALAVSVEGQGGSHSAASELVHVLTKYRQKLGLPLYTFAGDYVTGSSLLLLLSGTRVYASKTSLLGLTQPQVLKIDPTQALSRVSVKLQSTGSVPIASHTKNLLDQLEQDLKNARGQKLTSDLKDLRQGLVSGEEARKTGLVDEIGNCVEVLNQLHWRASLKVLNQGGLQNLKSQMSNIL